MQKLVHLVVYYDGKNVILKLSRTRMIRGGKLNLIFKDQMKNEKLVVVVQVKPIEGTKREAKKDGTLLKHIHKVLERYKDILTNDLPQELLPKKEVNHKIKVIPESKSPSKSTILV